MKITKDKLARALAKMPNFFTGKSPTPWEDLPHFKQLSYKSEADRFFEAIKILRREDGNRY